MSDGEVTLLETASYRLVGWESGTGFQYFALRSRRHPEYTATLNDYQDFTDELGRTLWGKERQP